MITANISDIKDTELFIDIIGSHKDVVYKVLLSIALGGWYTSRNSRNGRWKKYDLILKPIEHDPYSTLCDLLPLNTILNISKSLFNKKFKNVSKDTNRVID